MWIDISIKKLHGHLIFLQIEHYSANLKQVLSFQGFLDSKL